MNCAAYCYKTCLIFWNIMVKFISDTVVMKRNLSAGQALKCSVERDIFKLSARTIFLN